MRLDKVFPQKTFDVAKSEKSKKQNKAEIYYLKDPTFRRGDKGSIIQEDEEAKKHKREQIAMNFRREYEYWQRAREEHPGNTLDYV